MAKTWKPSRAHDAPRPQTTIHEIARRYHGAALALSQTLGLSVAEVLAQHRESVTAIFIEASRADLRLPATVTLPPLAPPGPPLPVAALSGQPAGPPPEAPAQDNGDASLPTTIPPEAELPCQGKGIATLKPAQLFMITSKVAHLAEANAAHWGPLLAALQAEHAARVQRGQRQPTANGSR